MGDPVLNLNLNLAFAHRWAGVKLDFPQSVKGAQTSPRGRRNNPGRKSNRIIHAAEETNSEIDDNLTDEDFEMQAVSLYPHSVYCFRGRFC